MDSQTRIRAIASDASLTPAEKAARIQGLYADMGRMYVSGPAPAVAQPPAACTHYKRNADVVAKCCNNAVFACRLCHDAATGHVLVSRTQVDQMRCRQCGAVQPVAASCMVPTCAFKSSLYFCEPCRLWNDDDKKNIYHCDECGICRVGKREAYFHCTAGCNLCQPVGIRASHKCVALAADDACPACLDALHASTLAVQTLPCGHSMHAKCFSDMARTGCVSCPKCRKTAYRDAEYEDEVRQAIATTPMPDEYARYRMEIVCNDCHATSVVKFHVFGAVCAACQSINTANQRTLAPETANDDDGAAEEEEDAEDFEMIDANDVDDE